MLRFLSSLFSIFSSSVFSPNKGPRQSVVTLFRVLKISSFLLVILFFVSTASVLVGATDIGMLSFLKRFFYGWQDAGTALTDTESTIIFSIRLPRIIFAAIVGAALSMAGVVFQALLRKPLADPYILGISGGSAVGAIVGIMAGISIIPFAVPAAAFLGAILTIIVVFGIAETGHTLPSNILLLAGVVVNAFFSAVIMFLISISSSMELHSIMFWLMGDLSLASGGESLLSSLFLLLAFVIIYAYARCLNLVVTGEEVALQLGEDVERTKRILLVVASLITAAAVSLGGIIGFVGLMVPHMVRMMFGSDHRLLIPAATLLGATFLVFADTVARTIMAPSELPVGVITAICGAPYFIYLLRKRGHLS
jgi:iron complex transport system permease protein